jgi:hypothetical protein
VSITSITNIININTIHTIDINITKYAGTRKQMGRERREGG